MHRVHLVVRQVLWSKFVTSMMLLPESADFVLLSMRPILIPAIDPLTRYPVMILRLCLKRAFHSLPEFHVVKALAKPCCLYSSISLP